MESLPSTSQYTFWSKTHKTMITRYRSNYTDMIRKFIGDTDKILFTEDELESYIARWRVPKIPFRINMMCFDLIYSTGGCNDPYWNMTIINGDDDAVYIIDEISGTVEFDAFDPDNTATPPVNGSTIQVQVYTIQTNRLVSELFMVLSSNHTKLAMAQSHLGVSMDLTQLSDSFYKSAVRWAAEI